jgi:hypothetical protein
LWRFRSDLKPAGDSPQIEAGGIRADLAANGLVLVAWTGGFLAALRLLKSRPTALWMLLFAGLILMVVPMGITALSLLYQERVRLDVPLGVPATAYAQAGFLTALFAGTALAASFWPGWSVQGALSLGLGGLTAHGSMR